MVEKQFFGQISSKLHKVWDMEIQEMISNVLRKYKWHLDLSKMLTKSTVL